MKETITLKNQMIIPRLGMGTWYLGEDPAKDKAETAALRAGLDAGERLIDTAEMYGNGLSEELVGRAIRGYDRNSLFLVSKVLPGNAGRKHIFAALDASLRRLGTDYLDLYLYHWRGSVPLAETVDCMEELVQSGKIRSWGVSNFDTDDMKELLGLPGGEHCVVNQVLYHLGSRGIEYDLLPYMKSQHIALMAYCPLAQGGSLRRSLLHSPAINNVAKRHHITPAQVLLAFVLHEESAIAIPRSGSAKHVLQNWDTRKVTLSEDDMRELNRAFPAPTHKTYLDIV